MEVDRVQEEEFKTYDMQMDEDMHARLWETETDKYFIRFMYITPEKVMDPETTAVRGT